MKDYFDSLNKWMKDNDIRIDKTDDLVLEETCYCVERTNSGKFFNASFILDADNMLFIFFGETSDMTITASVFDRHTDRETFIIKKNSKIHVGQKAINEGIEIINDYIKKNDIDLTPMPIMNDVGHIINKDKFIEYFEQFENKDEYSVEYFTNSIKDFFNDSSIASFEKEDFISILSGHIERFVIEKRFVNKDIVMKYYMFHDIYTGETIPSIEEDDLLKLIKNRIVPYEV